MLLSTLSRGVHETDIIQMTTEERPLKWRVGIGLGGFFKEIDWAMLFKTLCLYDWTRRVSHCV